MLDINNSRYVDFQKVRIQETQAELPRGSIPRRFVDIICRSVFHFLSTVEPRYDEGPRNWQNMLAMLRICCNQFLFQIFHYNWDGEYHLLYWGCCYIEGC